MKDKRLTQTILILITLLLLTNSIHALSIKNEITIKEANTNINPPEITKKINQLNPPFRILYPRFSCPAILEPGESLQIEIDENQFDRAYVNIETANEPVIDSFWLTITNINVNNTTLITVTIPENTPIELYNLTIFLENSGNYYSHSQPHSISLVENISENYSFIHISDLHIGDFRGITENLIETIGWKSVKRCINEVNVLSPDFVVITGDLVYGQLYPFEYTNEYKELYSILHQFDVPVYLILGNHDGYNRIFEDGLEFWHTYFGPDYYSFNYGSSHFQAINSYDHTKIERFTFFFIPLNWGGSIEKQQIAWIQQDLNSSKNSKIHFMLLHHNPLWDTTSESLIKKPYKNRETLLKIIDQHTIDMVIAGHVHYDNVTTRNDTIYLTTTTPQSSISKPDGYWGYRHIFIENGTIAKYNYKDPKYSNPTYKLEIETLDLFTKIVRNDLEIPIEAQIKYLLPKGTYAAQNGHILYQRENEIFTELYVNTEVESQSNIRVTITELTD